MYRLEKAVFVGDICTSFSKCTDFAQKKIRLKQFGCCWMRCRQRRPLTEDQTTGRKRLRVCGTCMFVNQILDLDDCERDNTSHLPVNYESGLRSSKRNGQMDSPRRGSFSVHSVCPVFNWYLFVSLCLFNVFQDGVQIHVMLFTIHAGRR